MNVVFVQDERLWTRNFTRTRDNHWQILLHSNILIVDIMEGQTKDSDGDSATKYGLVNIIDTTGVGVDSKSTKCNEISMSIGNTESLPRSATKRLQWNYSQMVSIYSLLRPYFFQWKSRR